MEETIIWPNGARMAFMLSFDVDGESLWFAKGADIAGHWSEKHF